MPARTAREALEELVSPLRDVVACISTMGLITTGTDAGPRPLVLTFPGGRPVRLQRRGNLGALMFIVRLGYTIVQHRDGRWAAEITGWMYQVDNADGREMFAYHWHPTGHSHVTRPHLHISGRTEPTEIGAAHYPTGPVTLADVVRLLIQDFDVRPRRADWLRILDATGT